MHFYAWKKGLKTGMYYLRTKAASAAIKFTVKKKAEAMPDTEEVFAELPEKGLLEASQVSVDPIKEYSAEEAVACSLDNPDDCEACGS